MNAKQLDLLTRCIGAAVSVFNEAHEQGTVGQVASDAVYSRRRKLLVDKNFRILKTERA